MVLFVLMSLWCRLKAACPAQCAVELPRLQADRESKSHLHAEPSTSQPHEQAQQIHQEPLLMHDVLSATPSDQACVCSSCMSGGLPPHVSAGSDEQLVDPLCPSSARAAALCCVSSDVLLVQLSTRSAADQSGVSGHQLSVGPAC